MTASPLGIRLQEVSAIFRHERRGEVAAVKGLNLDIAPGEFLTLLGASGCGKTTVLRMVAGFQPPTSGRVLFDGNDVTQLPANRRDIGFVFQNYALFPHLTVFENVAYGLRVKRLAHTEIEGRVERGLQQVGLQGLDDRMITELSGGQQQRVALARAIVIEPGVLLFDEPLSNLDAQLRVQMRSEISRLQKELAITTIYVTHDQEEAMAISDRIAIMNCGRIVQIGSAEDLYLRPASRFVANFLGTANLIEGRVVEVMADGLVLDVDGFGWRIGSSCRAPAGSQIEVVVRPEAVGLSDGAGGLRGRILSRTYLGSRAEYVVRAAGQDLQVSRHDPDRGPRFAEGADVAVNLPNDKVHVLEQRTDAELS